MINCNSKLLQNGNQILEYFRKYLMWESLRVRSVVKYSGSARIARRSHWMNEANNAHVCRPSLKTCQFTFMIHLSDVRSKSYLSPVLLTYSFSETMQTVPVVLLLLFSVFPGTLFAVCFQQLSFAAWTHGILIARCSFSEWSSKALTGNHCQSQTVTLPDIFL